MQAYGMMIMKKYAAAERMVNEAISAGRAISNDSDLYTAEYCKLSWFLRNDEMLERIIYSKGNFYSLPVHTKQKL